MQGKLVCPACGKLIHFSIVEKIDFMGEGVSLFAFNCECGYKGTDVFPEKIHEPRSLILKVNGDLNTLVARSSTGTIRIPEIGAEIKPGPASQGFITTIEGILLRIRKVFHTKPNKIDALLSGEPFTLVIKDPAGTSAIDSPDARIDILNDKYSF
ncbi:MAG: ZPR1 zinc finger domain-containing protein [Candidatus Altiarchaeota archaeon]|nr:ZPR1 zinc finger domain-containing protein [Candidatus Altiarchaeota archaeon]